MPTKIKVKKLKFLAKGKSINREKVWIDTNIINTQYKHLNNHVVFDTFNDDGDPSIVPEDIKSTFKLTPVTSVCFSALIESIRRNKSNRMFYTMETCPAPSSDYPDLLTPKERVRWLSITKEYGMLPQYIDEEVVKDTKGQEAKATVIIDLKDLPLSLLYIYLSTIRSIREDPGLPKAVLYLVNEVGMNFYLAYVFASAVILNHVGHHILGVYRPYGLCSEKWDGKKYLYSQISLDKLEQKIHVPIKTAIGLQRLLNNPKKYDERDYMSDNKIYNFDCTTIIDKISTVDYKASIQELFDDNIVAATMSETDREAKKYINKFEKEKPHINYMEVEK
jgi:hypothetical protein